MSSVSPRSDLEERIRSSYKLVCEYESILQISPEPTEKARCRDHISQQRTLIEEYLEEYRSLCEKLDFAAPSDILEIAAVLRIELRGPPPKPPPSPPTPPPSPRPLGPIPGRSWLLLALLITDFCLVLLWGWCLSRGQANLMTYLSTVFKGVGVLVAIASIVFFVRRPIALEDLLRRLGTDLLWTRIILGLTGLFAVVTLLFWPLGLVGECVPTPIPTITPTLTQTPDVIIIVLKLGVEGVRTMVTVEVEGKTIFEGTTTSGSLEIRIPSRYARQQALLTVEAKGYKTHAQKIQVAEDALREPVQLEPIPVTSTVAPTTTRTLTTPTSTLTDTPTYTPTRTPTHAPTDTPTKTLTCTSTHTPSNTPTHTLTKTSTVTPTHTPTYTLTHTPTATPTCHPVTIRLEGELDALKRKGTLVLSAIGVHCKDADGKGLDIIYWNPESTEYCLPDKTAEIQLWIGQELGGENWWNMWDSQPQQVTTQGDIVLTISRKETRPPLTDTPLRPTLSPTPRPTTTPVPTATHVPPASSPTPRPTTTPVPTATFVPPASSPTP